MSTVDRLEEAPRPAPGLDLRVRLGRWQWVPRGVARLLRATWRGALLGFVIATLGACALAGSGLFLGAGIAFDRLVGGALAGTWFLALWGVVRGVRWLAGPATGRLLARRPVRGLATINHWLCHPGRSSGIGVAVVLFAATFAVVPASAALAPSGTYVPAMLAAFLIGAVAGLAAALWPDAAASRAGAARLAAAWLAAFVAFALAASGLAFAAWPGRGPSSMPAPPSVAGLPSDLADPGQAGPYRVITTSYGSGLDPRRPEFGPSTPIRTPTVDASRAIDPIPWPGDAYARWLLGSGLDRLPLNALVWYPDGPGPFPLVLVVHGNHAMGDPSEPGYAYLGEHLASRGFVTASVDESMLNGNLFGDLHGAEMQTRAWVLLQHLDLWRGWTADPSSPFHGLADLSRVALIGHSRGGEAAAVAASMASADPSSFPALRPYPTGLSVDAVVAIAPCDGQIEGSGHGPNRLTGVDYLTIQGGLDADMAWWSGTRQLARTSVDGPGDDFKAAVWIRRANHGRFSSTWNLGDAGPQGDWLLDQAALLSPAEQEDVAKTVVAGFLEASLLDRAGYRSLFAVPALGRPWLPTDAYVTRIVAGSTVMLADFETGSDAATLTADGTTRVFKQELTTRAAGVSQLDKVAKVRWSGGSGLVTMAVPGVARSALESPEATLRFAVATASLDPGDPVPALTAELVDGSGRVAAVPLDAYGGVFPPMPTTPWKSREVAAMVQLGGQLENDAETHLQTFALPLSAFEAATPGFDPGSTQDVRFRISGPADGALYLDEIGIDPS